MPLASGTPLRERAFQTARFATMASAISILLSIPVSQILLGVALLATAIARPKLRWPPVWIPLALFLGWLLVSLAASPEPSLGFPQVKKLYVFTLLPVALAVLPRTRDYLYVFGGWMAVASASCLLAVGQFGWKFLVARETSANFYEVYVAERITGFMSHWMTFSGQAMMVALVLTSYLLFGPILRPVWRAVCWTLLALLLMGIVLGFTRGIWIATAIGAFPLLWCYRRWIAFAAPVVFVLALAFGPASVQDRFLSIFRPHGELDSNQHRVVTFATGMEMIKAHPWFGIGPERVGSHVEQYAPAWIHRPFPEGYYGHLHNIYIHYAAERGVPALVFLLGIFAVVLTQQVRVLRQHHERRSLTRACHLGVFSVVVAIMVGGIFEYNLGDSEILTMFLVVVAAGYSSLSASGSLMASGSGVVSLTGSSAAGALDAEAEAPSRINSSSSSSVSGSLSTSAL